MTPESHLDSASLLGLRQVRIPRYENEFGFTLRHFIVYPPDVYEKREYPNGATELRLGKITEPVDTIFVKSVREDGPAYLAGLCVGDRIVCVNGDRIVGRSYDQVVHLIQNSRFVVVLEVSPKQYDTLQLFYEEKAYRPETNQRPSTNHRTRSSHTLSQSQNQFYHPLPPPRTSYPKALPYDPYNTIPHDSRPLNNQRHLRRYYLDEGRGMSSAYPNQQPLYSHLPRPPPYKSSNTWSHLTPAPPKPRPQTYYPFNSPANFKPEMSGTLWGIREETKSSESILEGSDGSSSTLNSNRYGSMECLSNNMPPPVTWKNSPGYRFSISTGPGDSPGSLDALRRETSLQGPPGGFVSPTNQNIDMIVTMSGGRNEMPDYGVSSNDRVGSERAPLERNLSERGLNNMKGYEMKMADRIRRSTEQKEEFLRRPPNQPLQWAPLQTVSSVGGPVPFPKEFYAQPQKFQKVPWPPENRIPTISTQQQPVSSTMVSDELMTVSMRSHQLAATPHLLPSSKQQLNKGHMETLRTTYGGSLDETTSRRLDSVSNKLKQQQSFPKSSHHLGTEETPPSLTVSDFTTPGKNRMTVVGSAKVHCDPPKGWKHPSISFDETESHVQNTVHITPRSTSAWPPIRPNYLAIPLPNSHSRSETGRLDTDVILRETRKREDDPDYENDRLVRRVSYLKATSSPIDMDRKSSSPTTPTKSPSSEFRQFGSFPSEKSPDSTEVIREGQVHFKVRAGDAKKGGYYRTWRQGWAQIRRSGCLYLSKERITKETISGTETDVILCVGLKDGVSIDHAEDYTKRKNVLRLKTSSAVEGITIPVEVLIQGDDPFDTMKWLQTLQQQQDNNNSSTPNCTTTPGLRINPNEMNSPRSLLRTFLAPGQQQQGTPTGLPPSNNYLTITPHATATSHKSKTWKRRMAEQWKKIHPPSTTTTSPLHFQTSIPESGATIGVMLEDCPQSDNSLVPRILEYCVELVETKGLSVVGIYRIPGNIASVSALTESLNKGNEINPEMDQRWTDVHVISSLLKSFLRRLPDPVLTSARYEDFINAVADSNPENSLEKLRSLVQGLPDTNYETLRHLVFHLKEVAANSEKNKMDPKNLAIVFGPTVVRTAEENLGSFVNNMKHQCKIVELLINYADEIFKEKEDSPTPPEEVEIHRQNDRLGFANSSPPKIENDIVASLIQAAQRKKQGVQQSPGHNTYGLPSRPLERDRSVDESGLIRSYAGLGEETEQRVRQFEMETKAHLYRDARSPGLPSHLYAAPKQPIETEKLKKERFEAEWKKAKDDLENDDFYDQLADNPSTILEHSVQYHQSTNQNRSNSSISSTNSRGTPNSVLPPYGTWPIRLGPIPFKSQFSSETLPPKPPILPSIAPFTNSMRKAIGTTSPLRKVSSTERMSHLNETEFEERNSPSRQGSARNTLKSLKNVEGSLHYESKVFGSLDSLQNLANGSRENLSDGSDFVSSLSKTLNEKMERLRGNETPPPEARNSRLDEEVKANGGRKVEDKRWDKGLILGKRRNSLIEHRRKMSLDEKIKNGLDQQSHSHHSGTNGDVKYGKDLTEILPSKGKGGNRTWKKSKELQRRHSLSGTVDILRFVVLGDQKKSHHRHSDIHISADTLANALTANNILESHV